MSTNFVFGAAGAVAGFFIGSAFGNPFMGAVYGWAIGSAAGAILNPPEMIGPRLEDLKAQASTYGWPIPVVYGTMRQAGNVIWQPPLIEVSTEEDSKGGAEVTSFSYFAHCAVLLCRGPIAGVRRIWANKRLIYDVRSTNTGPQSDPVINGLRIYLGDETQTPDALIVAHEGDAPGYRGWAYVVFESLALSEHFGNRLPLLEFEIITNGSSALPDAQEIGDDSGGDSAIVTADGELWTGYGADAGGGLQKCVVQISNPAALAELAQIEQNESGGGMFGGGIGAGHLMEIGNEIWVWNSALVPDSIMRFSKITRAYISSHQPAWGFNHIGAGYFDPLTGHVFAYGINVGAVVKILNPTTMTVTSGFLAPGSSVQAVADIKSVTSAFGGGIAILAGDVDTGGGLHLYPPAIDYSLVTPDFTYGAAQGFPDGFTNQGSRLAYDEARGNLVVFGNIGTNRKLVVINLLASTLNVIDWEATFGTRYSVTRNGVYHAGRDKYYAAGLDTSAPDAPSGGPSSRQVIEIDPVTFMPVRTIVHADEIIVGVCNDLLVPKDSNQFLIWMNISLGGATPVYKFPLDPALDPADVFLGDIVRDICTQADMVPASDINADALNAIPVKGYTIPRQMAARAAIEPLQGAFFFDGVESDDKLKFVVRGGAIATTIVEDDRAAHEPGTDKPAGLDITKLQEIESPATLELRFIDINRDYEISSVYDRRLVKKSKQQITMDLAIAMDHLKASQAASVNLYLSWQRTRLAWKTTRKYAKYEPTDVVTIPTANALYNVRIAGKRELPNGLIEWEGAIEDAAIYSQNGVASAVSNYPGQTVTVPGNAVMHLMDIPIMRDDDNDAGFYAAHCTTGTEESGCNLYRSTDGTAYSLSKQFPTETAIGVTSGALATGTKGNVFDYSQTLTVVMIRGELASDTQLNVLNGANLAVYGNELIQFKTATLTAPKTYQLSGLLRGRFGTEREMGAHAAGERFVMVNVTTWRRILAEISEIGLTRFWKAPLFGSSVSSAPAQNFANSAVGLEPLSGVQLRGERDGSDNLTITWKRRTRIGGGWRDLVDVPLGESSESYEVEIWDSTFTTLKRTKTGLTTPSASYPASEQTTDFGSPQAVVYARAFQLSTVVGRGFKLEGSI